MILILLFGDIWVYIVIWLIWVVNFLLFNWCNLLLLIVCSLGVKMLIFLVIVFVVIKWFFVIIIGKIFVCLVVWMVGIIFGCGGLIKLINFVNWRLVVRLF